MTPARQRLLIASLVLSVSIAPGCGSGANEKPTGFVGGGEQMTKQGDFPFHKVWFASNWNDPARKSIVISRVDTRYVKESNWYKKAEEKGKVEELKKDLDELAVFTRDEFQKAFREDANKRFKVVNSAQSNSVVFELAIVDVEPNTAALGAVGLAATILAAPLGVAILAKEAAKGGIAMEGRLKDAKSGQVIAMFRDREKGKFAPINVARATAFGEVQKSIREWAEQWVKVANAPPGEKVKDNKPFTLRPW